MAQAAVPILNILILGSFMAYAVYQLRQSETALTRVRIEDRDEHR